MIKVRRRKILGVGISVLDLKRTLQLCRDLIGSDQPAYVCLAPAHSVMDCYYDPQIKDIFNNSTLTLPDGMAIAWILNLKGEENAGRVYGPDLLLDLCKISEETGWKHYFYGSTEIVLDNLQHNLSEKYPDLAIVGKFSPPFSEELIPETQTIIEQINSSAPDIIWVGLGSPKQDRWMAEHRDRLSASVLIGVGAAFDFIAGNLKQAPSWVQQIGMEWLYRFLQEPARLWKRYSRYPLFVLLVLLEFLGIELKPR